MISAIAGDLIGSRYEFHTDESKNTLFTNSSRFTDDTILTVATANAILNKIPYSDSYFTYAKRYPKNGYGKAFSKKVEEGKLAPYNSFGNGSAMRVGPVAWAFNDIKTILEQAKLSAECTHSHQEGIRGAQAVCYLIWLCRTNPKDNGMPKVAMKKAMVDLFGDSYKKEVKDFEKGKFDVTCQGTVPLCAAIFYETNGFEEAMWKSIEMGGDVDTNCCIIGSFCDAYYGFPSEDIVKEVYLRLSRDMAGTVTEFICKYVDPLFKPPHIVDVNNTILSLDIEGILS